MTALRRLVGVHPARDPRELREEAPARNQQQGGELLGQTAPGYSVYRLCLRVAGKNTETGPSAISRRLGLARMTRDKGQGIPLGSGNDTQNDWPWIETVFGLSALGVPELQGVQSLCRALTTNKSRDHPIETICIPCRGQGNLKRSDGLAACWCPSVQRGQACQPQ